MQINIANLENQEQIIEMLQLLKATIVDISSVDWGTYFLQRSTGEVFTTEFYNLSVTDTTDGTKADASEGKVCVPSTETVKGQDDFASYNAFWYTLCDFIVTDDGVKKPTTIQGQSSFTKTGKVQVGVLTPPLYYGIEVLSDRWRIHLSDAPHPELNLVLMPHCRDNKGNPMGYGIVPAYYASKGDDGKPYGCTNAPVYNFVSYQSFNTAVQLLGSGYVGAGAERSAYLRTMLMIKYATQSSQKVFNGCTNFNLQYAAAEETTGQKYIVLTKAQANGFYVGCTVSLGNCTNTSDTDRGNAYMRDVADLAKVTKIEAIDDEKSRVYVDTADVFDTTTATYISTMPLHSGQTDNVLGADGYVANDGKHSFRIQGVEDGIGAYFVSMTELMDKDTATDTDFYVRDYAAFTTAEETAKSSWRKIGRVTRAASDDFWIGETQIDLMSGAEYPTTVASGSASGKGDRFNFGGTGAGLREMLQRGDLWYGANAGLSYVDGWNGVSGAYWGSAACVS